MRRIVMFNRVTADGFFAGPDGNLDWAVPDAELDRSAVASLPGTDTVLLGRRTYEMFEGFWPRAVAGSGTAPNPHAAGQLAQEMHALGTWLNETTKLVFSKTLKEVGWRNSRLIHQLDAGEIEAMKRQPGKDMIVLGSGSIVSQLTQQGLIDEYQLAVSPVLIGSGRPLLREVSKRSRLKLVEARPYPSGNVMLRYARAS